MSSRNDRLIFTRGNLQALINKIKAEIVAPAVNNIFPVGSIYMTSKAPDDGGDPNALFPGTTWVRLKDTFIWAAGDNDTVVSAQGASGHTTSEDGSLTTTIETNNLPSHTHSMTHYHDRGTIEISGTIAPVCSFRGSGDCFETKSGVFTGSNMIDKFGNTNGSSQQMRGNVYFKASNGWSGRTSAPYSAASGGSIISNTGDGGFAKNAISIKNPRINRYCWERTA